MTGRTKFVSYHRNSVGIQVSISHGEYRNCQISETKKKFLSKKKNSAGVKIRSLKFHILILRARDF